MGSKSMTFLLTRGHELPVCIWLEDTFVGQHSVQNFKNLPILLNWTLCINIWVSGFSSWEKQTKNRFGEHWGPRSCRATVTGRLQMGMCLELTTVPITPYSLTSYSQLGSHRPGFVTAAHLPTLLLPTGQKVWQT